jgi:Domain of unknown function (DUF4411)
MLYLVDANAIIHAKDQYFAIDQVPEYWAWLIYQGESGRIKIPREIFEEISPGRDKDDPFYLWRRDKRTAEALVLNEDVDMARVRQVLAEGYAPDLDDNEIEQIGADPFLIAYALVDTAVRNVVTTEVSKPSRIRANRHLPDVCYDLGVTAMNTFQMNRALSWRTSWTP